MGRTLVESPRVRNAIAAMFPGRTIKSVLARGNYPRRTFLVVFEDYAKGEMVTIPPVSKKRIPLSP